MMQNMFSLISRKISPFLHIFSSLKSLVVADIRCCVIERGPTGGVDQKMALEKSSRLVFFFLLLISTQHLQIIAYNKDL